MTARGGRIYGNALARHVHANGLRFQTTGRVRDAEMLYDQKFPKGECRIETAWDGSLRIMSLDGSLDIKAQPTDEGRLFKYTDAGRVS